MYNVYSGLDLDLGLGLNPWSIFNGVMMEFFGGFIILGYFIVIIVGLAVYAFNGMTYMLIGQKAGMQDNWMPFVPVARSLYRLRMMGEQWWKAFFFGGTAYGTFLILFWLQAVARSKQYSVNALLSGGSSGWSAFATILMVVSILHLLCVYAYRFVYYKRFYEAFSVNSAYVVALIFPGTAAAWNLLAAYTQLLSFRGVANGPSLAHVNEYLGSAGGLQQPPVPAPPMPGSMPMHMQGGQGGFSGSVTCVAGMYKGSTFQMLPNEELLMGRDAGICSVVLDRGADKVSRKHCGVFYNMSSGTYYVTDYSTNGTTTREGARLVNNIPTAMSGGSVICLGSNDNSFILN